MIRKLPTGEFSIFYLVFVAEETGLKLALSEPRRQVLMRRGPDALADLPGKTLNPTSFF